jgi:hypothetical protein
LGGGLFYKQAAPLGLKRFGGGLFYKQAAPLGLKRFGDGFFYKQAAPLLGLKRFGVGSSLTDRFPITTKLQIKNYIWQITNPFSIAIFPSLKDWLPHAPLFHQLIARHPYRPAAHQEPHIQLVQIRMPHGHSSVQPVRYSS